MRGKLPECMDYVDKWNVKTAVNPYFCGCATVISLIIRAVFVVELKSLQ